MCVAGQCLGVGWAEACERDVCAYTRENGVAWLETRSGGHAIHGGGWNNRRTIVLRFVGRAREVRAIFDTGLCMPRLCHSPFFIVIESLNQADATYLSVRSTKHSLRIFDFELPLKRHLAFLVLGAKTKKGPENVMFSGPSEGGAEKRT